MHEIELKLQIPAAQRRAVAAAVAGRRPPVRVRLQAAYQDTPDRALAEAGLALRLRREGRQWVQTLKGAGDDGLSRFEHNVPRGAAAAMPAVDPALHAGTPAGDRLLALLSRQPPAALASLYRTDIRRLTRVLAVRPAGRPGAKLELACDEGRILAGDAVLPVGELEIELLAGAPSALIDLARRWVARHGLWVDGRSKAERGDLLARGRTMAAPRLAGPVDLPPDADRTSAWQAVLRNCADQVLANASQVASGEHAPEHVHQLRVGLRRLRSALAFFEVPAPALAEGAAVLFRALGAARDQVVADAAFGPDLERAMRAAGLAPGTVERGAPPSPDCAPLVRTTASQALLLDLIAAMHAAPPVADPQPLRERLAARLDRWHRQVVRAAKRHGSLDDEARHRLRKRAKRLRYATEFCAGLFPRKAVRRYLKALRALQERLGEVTDVMMAMDVHRPRAATDPAAMFALGWLAARREVLIAQAAPELKSFVKAAPYWR